MRTRLGSLCRPARERAQLSWPVQTLSRPRRRRQKPSIWSCIPPKFEKSNYRGPAIVAFLAQQSLTQIKTFLIRLHKNIPSGLRSPPRYLGPEPDNDWRSIPELLRVGAAHFCGLCDFLRGDRDPRYSGQD